MAAVPPLSSSPAKAAELQKFSYALRTSLAAAASMLAARRCGLPEVIWAVITTIIVAQSSRGAAWDTSWQRLIGTVLGGVTSLAILAFFKPGLLTLSVGMLAMGLTCALMRLQASAYRFAGITLAIIMLPTHSEPIMTVAVNRFLGVTLGIIVGMAAMYLWPERPTSGTAEPPKQRA